MNSLEKIREVTKTFQEKHICNDGLHRSIDAILVELLQKYANINVKNTDALNELQVQTREALKLRNEYSRFFWYS